MKISIQHDQVDPVFIFFSVPLSRVLNRVKTRIKLNGLSMLFGRYFPPHQNSRGPTDSSISPFIVFFFFCFGFVLFCFHYHNRIQLSTGRCLQLSVNASLSLHYSLVAK